MKQKLKFSRGYSRTFGNNVWNAGNIQIVRHGSSYWGFTGYFVTVNGVEVGSADKFEDAKQIAQTAPEGK